MKRVVVHIDKVVVRDAERFDEDMFRAHLGEEIGRHLARYSDVDAIARGLRSAAPYSGRSSPGRQPGRSSSASIARVAAAQLARKLFP